MARVLIIGGYGTFGGFIARRLVAEPDLTVIVAGRSQSKAEAFAAEIGAEAAVFDIAQPLAEPLAALAPDIVIHTSGPFQGQDYGVAQACLAQGAHYVDLADGRDFVAGIEALNAAAQAAGVLVVSGASSVPCLTSAAIDAVMPEFARLEALDYAITTAQKTPRGLATTEAILSYVGRPFTTLQQGAMRPVYGWQGLHRHRYRHLGPRMLGHCDIPDLALFPARYPSLNTIRFSAGLELPLIHGALWALSWLVRWRVLRRLPRFAKPLLWLSNVFDRFGSDQSGFHMRLTGQGADGQPHEVRFELTARSGDGPYIPCIPAILLAKGLAQGTITAMGAQPCMGLITLDAYLAALADFDITWERLAG